MSYTPKQLAEELGKHYLHIGKIRKYLFPDGDPKNITDDEAEVIREYVNGVEEKSFRQELEEAVKPQYVNAVVVYQKEGNRFCECALEETKERVVAWMPADYAEKNKILSRVKLETIEHNGKRYYRHSGFSAKAWEPFYKQRF